MANPNMKATSTTVALHHQSMFLLHTHAIPFKRSSRSHHYDHNVLCGKVHDYRAKCNPHIREVRARNIVRIELDHRMTQSTQPHAMRCDANQKHGETDGACRFRLLTRTGSYQRSRSCRRWTWLRKRNGFGLTEGGRQRPKGKGRK
ncbi:hypothetical protein ACLOJK_012138 [Asimina triloba]